MGSGYLAAIWSIMDFWQVIIVFLVGLIAGIINTLAGGGSLLTLPLLIFLGLPSAVANGTNRIAILLQNIVGIVEYAKKGLLNFRLAFLVSIPALVGAWWGAQVAVQMEDRLFNRILACVLVLCVGLILWRTKYPQNNPSDMGKKSLIFTLLAFLFVGLYGGFIQAGVGYLILGALTIIAGLDLVQANAIKVFVVFFYNLSALALFIWAGKIDWPLAINMALGNMIGAKVGVHLAVRKGQVWVRLILVLSVLAFAIKLLWQA